MMPQLCDWPGELDPIAFPPMRLQYTDADNRPSWGGRAVALAEALSFDAYPTSRK
jgi:hypothetical protein